jgi:hypothetical protein
MITVDFDSANIPAGGNNCSCILNCKTIRLQARAYIKNQIVVNDELQNDKEFGGSIDVRRLDYKPFKVLIKTDSGLEGQNHAFEATDVIFVADNWKDWTKTLYKNKIASKLIQKKYEKEHSDLK